MNFNLFQMHSSSFDTEESTKDGGEVLVSIAALVTEGRIPGKLDSKSKKFYEGPHCNRNKPNPEEHTCDLTDSLVRSLSVSHHFATARSNLIRYHAVPLIDSINS